MLMACINFIMIKMMTPKFMTNPSGLVKRIREALRYWQGYGEGNGMGLVWKCYQLPELKNITLTEPIMPHVTSYTLDEYVALGKDKRYAKFFRYVVVPGKPRLDLKQIKEPGASEKIEDICNSVAEKFVKAIGISPSEQLGRDYGKLHDPNPTPFGGMPPRFIITLD